MKTELIPTSNGLKLMKITYDDGSISFIGESPNK